MIAFFHQMWDALANHRVGYFVVFCVVVWATWGSKAYASRRYQPYTAPYSVGTSVIIPVVDEEPEVFREVLRRIVEQHPTEVHVVINGPRSERVEMVCDEFAPLVRWEHTSVAGKRNALCIGVAATTQPVLVIVDSDTFWEPDALPELVKPFADAEVGGVTTSQRIWSPERSIWTRWLDWMESLRIEYSMPAMSATGAVGCLPGRTIALRREIFERHADEFMTDIFLGIHLEISDDRTLTNYALKDGYRTVYQSTSQVLTDAPTNLKKVIKQQYRWSKGSQYNTLRMMPWMLRHRPALAFWYAMDIMIPYMLVGVLFNWWWAVNYGNPRDLLLWASNGAEIALEVLVTMTLGMLVGFNIRQRRHVKKNPTHWWRLPGYVILATLVLIPIRVVGFVRAGHNEGWQTRAGGYVGDENNSALLALPYVIGFLLVVACCGTGLLLQATW